MTDNEKAAEYLFSVYRKLESVGHHRTVQIIQNFYPVLVPHFVKAGAKNPVHHTPCVMDLLTYILIGERIDPFDVQISLLAALFHDAGLGRSTAPKITEAHLRDKAAALLAGQCTLDAFEAYVGDAVSSRKEHMRAGEALAFEILSTRNQELPKVDRLEARAIREIMRIVAHHDDPKIPVIYLVLKDKLSNDPGFEQWCSALDHRRRSQVDRVFNQELDAYLIGIDDWLLQYHHEADLLWMVTADGIEADLRRFHPDEGKTPRGILENNVALQQDEVRLYQHRDDFPEYGFINDTVYRSRTGFALFEDLRSRLEHAL